MEISPDRYTLLSRLREDLVGPHKVGEQLPYRPTDVYLTGILWPQPRALNAEQAGEIAEEDEEQLPGAATSTNDDPGDEAYSAVPAGSVQKPSVCGLSFSVRPGRTCAVSITCGFSFYSPVKNEKTGLTEWAQTPVSVFIPNQPLQAGRQEKVNLEDYNPDASGVTVHIRAVAAYDDLLLVTTSLINETTADEGREGLERACLFQTTLEVKGFGETALVPKPSRQLGEQDPSEKDPEYGVTDEESSALLFRNVAEFAVGHVCSANWGMDGSDGVDGEVADWVATDWVPSALVEDVDPGGSEHFRNLGAGDFLDPLSARDLGGSDDLELMAALESLCKAYESWLEEQWERLDAGRDVPANLAHIARANLRRCDQALRRMRSAVQDIQKDEHLRKAFRLANVAMDTQYGWATVAQGAPPLRWRPFQLAFVLMACTSAARKDDDQRETMDLLWFPTGGGKTEAYLALIALVAVYRRLSSDGSESGSGVSALMRYTLRLLTTQQFARSAAVIIALEGIRKGRFGVGGLHTELGEEPFSIGLWVGGEATPNKRQDAWNALMKGVPGTPSPKQLARCPVCHELLSWSMEDIRSPVVVECRNDECSMQGEIPVTTIDEDVYERRPTLVIGTTDKFAQVPRQKSVNYLFGISDGNPPDLVLQDELHLISGPLGTIAGTYESALDLLFTARGSRPKIIGSTATIRRAEEQVRALFDREAFQFPPPAIDHNNSGFAVRDERPEATGRRYVGVTTAGRSAKFTLQAVSASLLQSAWTAFTESSRSDPYHSLVGYFNSMRELGGALVLMQDDVGDSIKLYSDLRGEKSRPVRNVEELTSRRTQEEILEMLDQLNIKADQKGAVDVVLATNMVSVGVDIPRLGLMVVNGQPKTISEYIQSTSRVGRGDVSGLVVSVLNNAKVRDRSHFETFPGWHQALYRDVEATSVTPFATRARDRALHGALVMAVRHLVPGMLENPVLDEDSEQAVQDIIDQIVKRAHKVDPNEADATRKELEEYLDEWIRKEPAEYWNDYKPTKSLLQSAEQVAAKRATGREIGSAWPALNSMRTVEAGTPFRLAKSLGKGDSGNGE